MTDRDNILRFPEIPRPAVSVTLWDRPGRPHMETLRAGLRAEGYEAVRWASEANQVYLPHAHIYAELLWLIEGSLAVILVEERRIIDLNPGDRIHVPAGIQHASQAGPEGAVYLVAAR